MSENSSENNRDYSELLNRTHKKTAMVVNGVLTLMLAFVAIAYLMMSSARTSPLITDMRTPTMVIDALILLIAVGAIVYRRTLFQGERLRGIFATGGVKGLLSVVSNTTVVIAGLSFLIVLLGSVCGWITRDAVELFKGSLIGFVIYFYSYPRKSVWERVVRSLVNSEDSNVPMSRGVNA